MYLSLHGIPREGTRSLEDKDYCLLPKDFTGYVRLLVYFTTLIVPLQRFFDSLLLGLILIDHVDGKYKSL